MFETNGESNEVCLARVMLRLSEIDFAQMGVFVEDLIAEGVIYAGEVLNARDLPDLPPGLCDYRGNHEPHDVTRGTLAPYRCTADQSQRQPFKAERERKGE